jgi:hypothetical protein
MKILRCEVYENIGMLIDLILEEVQRTAIFVAKLRLTVIKVQRTEA